MIGDRDSSTTARTATTATTATMDPDTIDAMVPPAMERLGVPGVAIAIVDGADATVRCYGTAANGDRRPVAPDTSFPLGGLTKPVTATAAMILAAEGRLDLDERISNLFRTGLTDDGIGATTLRLVLSHLAGLADDPLVVDLRSPLGVTAAPLLAATRLLPPGLAYSYSNAGYAVVGAAIEAASRRPFRQAIEELVLEPAGMAGRFGRTGDAGVATSVEPALGLAASANDLASFMTASLGHGTEPGRLTTVQRPMRRPAGRADGPFHSVGLGWYTSRAGDTLLCQHGGGDRDLGTLLVLAPDRRLGVAVLTNAMGGNTLKFDIVRAVLGGWRIELGRPTLVEPDWDVRAYAGRYEDPQRIVQVDVERDAVRVHVSLAMLAE